MTSLNIPIVDLEDLRSEDVARRQSAAQSLREAFGTLGLVYVRNHGIDAKALGAFYDAFRAFVAQPEAEKRAFAHPDLWYQRGWTPPNTEVAVASGGQPDFKECYFAAPYPTDPDMLIQYPELYPENVWPEPEPAGFREGFLALGRGLHEAGLGLLRGCALALGLGEDTFADLVEHGPHITRVLNYLPLSDSQVNTPIVWGEEHTDFNLLTLLPGGRFFDPAGQPGAAPDAKSGLYLRTRATAEAPQGTMVRGSAPEGCITAQVGQQLEILTGGAFLATPHVITAPGVPGWSRLSSAHFMHLQSNQMLFPLAPFRTPATLRSYAPPVLAGTYSIKTLVDIGLAPREALDKLGYRHYDRLDSMRSAEKTDK
jgi:isopenicillin N synthase-like dioxygenase